MRLLATVLALLAGPALALDLDPGPGARLVVDEASPADGHRLAAAPWAEGTLPARVAEGAVRRRVWQVPSAGTTLQLLAPLRAQAEEAGLAPLLDCDTEACGGFDFRLAVEVLPPPEMFLDLGDFRYLSAEGPGNGGEALSLLVSRGAGRGFIQAITVTGTDRPVSAPEVVPGAAPEIASGVVPGAAPEIAPGPAPAAEAPGAPGVPLAAEMDAVGHAILHGLAFATGSAELAPAGGGEGVLEALAAYLVARPGLRIALVGHTDSQGSLDANVALSRRRAAAVLDRLVALGVARGRLEAGGMGYLAPVASNLTPEGREMNRRVEAVILSED